MIWFYGQAPSFGDQPSRYAFRGDPHGTFLAELAGVPEHEMRRRISFLNVLTEWPGRSGGKAKGDLFPIAKAKAAADELMDVWQDGDRVVFAGGKVAAAFGIKVITFVWMFHDLPDGGGITVAGFPHPSKVNRLWNDQTVVEDARMFMHELIAMADRAS